jgi:hypothetical protein
MSSLPPYNPPRSQRISWLLHQDGAGDAIAWAGPNIGDLGAAWVEREQDRDAVAALVDAESWDTVDPGALPELVATIRRTRSSTLVVAGPATLDVILRELVELPPGRARLRFIPGLATTVQVLPDRAVLRHLNQGGALVR